MSRQNDFVCHGGEAAANFLDTNEPAARGKAGGGGDEFGLGGRQSLGLQQQVAEVPITAAPPQQRLDIAVHGFYYPQRHAGPAIAG
jgi:hypothetical protein